MIVLNLGQVDWNCDGRFDPSVQVDLGGGGSAVLTGFKDWTSLIYDFQSRGNFEDGVRAVNTIPEITMEQAVKAQAVNHAPVAVIVAFDGAVASREVELDASGSFDEDQDPLTYSWTVVAGRRRCYMRILLIQRFSLPVAWAATSLRSWSAMAGAGPVCSGSF